MQRTIILLTALLLTVTAQHGQAEDDAMLVGDKTLVAWVAPADVNRRNGGPLCMDNLSGNFDAITYGEIAPAKWMAGSDWFKRTQRNQNDSPAETTDPDTPVQIAITYSGKQVTIYRNGEVYAQYEHSGQPVEFGVGGVIVIGRHVFDDASKHFAGRIDDVRVYDVPLTADQVKALKPNRKSKPEPWAWWTFEKGSTEEETGNFSTMVFGEPKFDKGCIVLDGEDDALVALQGDYGPEIPGAPPAPSEYANVFSVGYGQAFYFPTNNVEFEELLVNMTNGGYNAILCVYTDERLELCRKHKVKMMIDVLAWKTGAETDVRRPPQQALVREICEKVRGDDAVWGYNIWNERLDRYGPGSGGTLNGLILAMHKWDPTHPIWVGTYLNYFAGNVKYNPGCPAYYDYHWERGRRWHFGLLPGWMELAENTDGYFGRWMRNHDYNRSMYTMNTSIAFGLKTGIWFICGPWHPANPNWNPDYFLCTMGREMQKLWPEIGKIKRPSVVYSTPITKSAENRDVNPPAVPVGTAIPEDFWLQVRGGEALLGQFKYPDGNDAFYVANHNAYTPQKMEIELSGDRKKATVELFDRADGKWKKLDKQGSSIIFDLGPGGGELIKVSGK